MNVLFEMLLKISFYEKNNYLKLVAECYKAAMLLREEIAPCARQACRGSLLTDSVNGAYMKQQNENMCFLQLRFLYH